MFLLTLLLVLLLQIVRGREITVCGSDGSLDVSCPRGRVLVFEWVEYGRQDAQTCTSGRGSVANIECRLPSALALVQENCFRKSACNFNLQSTLIPDPCPKTSKYLKAEYSCVSDSDIITMCDSYFIKDRTIGYIISPNYPSHYNPHMKCTSEIQMSSKTRLELLDLEVEARETKGCYDWLIMMTKDSAIEKYDYCGTMETLTGLSPKIVSLQDAVVSFMPDQMNNYRGFLIKFEGTQSLNPDTPDENVNSDKKRVNVNNDQIKDNYPNDADEEDQQIKQLQESLKALERKKKQKREEMERLAKVRQSMHEQKKIEREAKENRRREEAQRRDRDEFERKKMEDAERVRQFEVEQKQNENADSFGRPAGGGRFKRPQKKRSVDDASDDGCVRENVPVPLNAYIHTFKEARRVQIECIEGFMMAEEDSGLLVCHNDKWAGDPGDCLPQACPEPETPDHGEVIFRKTSVGSDVEYICHKGYVLVGPRSLTCLPEAKWSGNTPYCSKGGVRSLSLFGEMLVAVILTFLFMFFRKRCWPLKKLNFQYLRSLTTRSKTKAKALTY